MNEELRADRGPCTECGTPHDACVGPDYCCDECLHLDKSWDGYEQPGRARPTADVTREPTGGQELREAIKETLFLYGIRGERLGSLRPGSLADAVLALPELAALIADREQYARQRAAEELRAAADKLRTYLTGLSAGTLRAVRGYLRDRADALDGDQ